MRFSSFEKEKLSQQNEIEYGRYSAFFKWIEENEIEAFRAERDFVLDKIENSGGKFSFKGSKTDTESISPGCRCCGEGTWSCLFISGICNASCFYCPTRQDTVLKPSTNTLEFNSPENYAQYVKDFNFKGVSMSGGEPFITFELMMKYINAVKKKTDPYMWVYTNGSLADEKKIKRLRDAGVKEIRFDIGAFDYSLKKAEMAASIMDTVTVEVPMVPEHTELMKNLLHQMKNAGVKHLNLHQMRVTPHNFPKMLERDYKFIHGQKVTVLESEISALNTLLYSLNENLIPVNYCSFVFKRNFQSAAARKRYASVSIDKNESVTQNGYIREIKNISSPERTIPFDEFLKMEEHDDIYTLTYFNPTATGKVHDKGEHKEKYHVERNKMTRFRMTHREMKHVFEKIDENNLFSYKESGRINELVPDFNPNGNSISLKDFYEIFQIEILRGGFADYF